MAVWAVPAFADAPQDPGTGFLQVCKTSDGTINPTVGGVPQKFNFHIVDSAGHTWDVSTAVGANGQYACTDEIEGVTAGTVTVTEASAPWYKVSALSWRDSQGTNHTLTPGDTATVTVTASTDQSVETNVFYTNTLVTGEVEICKNGQPNSGASGTFNFKVTGANGYSGTASVTIPPNGCAAPLTVPAGTVTVQEVAPVTYVTDIEANGPDGNSTNGAGGEIVNESGNPNLGTATVDVIVNKGNAATETTVFFTDSQSVLKICKEPGPGYLDHYANTASVFNVTAGGASSTVSAYPLPTAGNDDSGSCAFVGAFAPGTPVTVSEAGIPGTVTTEVDWNDILLNGRHDGNITSTPSNTGTLPNGTSYSTNLDARTVSFVIGSGVNEIEWWNMPAAPVSVKYCKAGPAGAGGTISVNGTSIGHLAPGACTQPTTGSAMTPYGGTLAITEAPDAGFQLASISIDGNGSGGGAATGNAGSVTAGLYQYAVSGGTLVVTLTNAAAPPVTPPSGGSGGTGGTGGSTGAPPAPAPAAPTAPSNTSSTSSSSSSSSSSAPSNPAPSNPAPSNNGSTTSLNNQTPPAVNATKHVFSIVTAHFVTLNGTRWLGIQLKGNAKTAHVRIVLIGKNGHVIGKLVRIVHTGSFVRVMKIGANVQSVRVSPLAL
ncbi:MAG: hypothetical protein JO073_01940 [Actinobacteria bacterium]|nr:hypothetical protein [Actinomycetota bacterium]